jgi:pyridoxamine 5'-phosphate oxidase
MQPPPRETPLLEDDVAPDPLTQFAVWFREAKEAASGFPEAMTLATATKSGEPSARTLLLKGFDDRGFVFYSNYESRKGRELAENPRAALVFHWRELGRQVRVEGRVVRIPSAESEAYFVTRPFGSRLAAWASPQSDVVESRDALDARFAEVSAAYEGRDAQVPPFWGGFRLTPETVEFWQHRENRLHDRLRYTRDRNGWLLERLAP